MKLKNDCKEINCVPAVIRKCTGFVVETVTVQPLRKNIFNVLDELVSNGYHIHTLRHPDNDMSKPTAVTGEDKYIIVNRFGWFVTKDKMDGESKFEIQLSKKNCWYGDSVKEGDCINVNKYYEYGSGHEISIKDYISSEDEIIKALESM